MTHTILGLHHVTATVDEAQTDLDFCLAVLGLRLVKKTVNFDNHHVYHFYYGDEEGTPGTIWTTFPYTGRGVQRGVKGAGQVVATAFSVPASSLDVWEARLRAMGTTAMRLENDFGEVVLALRDPSGLNIELIGTDSDRRTPWIGNGVDGDAAIRGLHSVTMVVHQADATLELMTNVLGYHIVGQDGQRCRLAAGVDSPGHFIDVVVDPSASSAINGLGTVHHVAMAIATPDAQLALREDLLQRGLRVTDVRDRCYFQSIYFREPGGVLFEVATIQPGFSVDEDLASLGRALKLPPWEETFRTEIEAGLVPVRHC